MPLLSHFQHITLTNDQQLALMKIQAFLAGDKRVFLLKGYAGSGKTTLLKGIVAYLAESKINYQLMAPTGRAAKIIQQKTGFGATTVHKGIYCFDELEELKTDESDASFIYYYKLIDNQEVHNSVLLIDEASMVSDVDSVGEFFRFGSGKLLTDLMEYAQLNHLNSTSKIVFIGDPAQLPPIGMNFSPALDDTYLTDTFHTSIELTEMTEVKRQDAQNGILRVATNLRRCLTSGYFNNFNLQENEIDIFNPAYEQFFSEYAKADGTKIIVTYKNKTAQDLNQNIRIKKYGADLPIQKGDIIIIGGNNYSLGVMNGEFGVVSKVAENPESRTISLKLRGGETKPIRLTWRLVELLMPDNEGKSNLVKGYLLENFLSGENQLSSLEQQALFVDFLVRHPGIGKETVEFKDALMDDPYFHCILLKYGYAVTCHKAQGGEWDTAFTLWDKAIDFSLATSSHTITGKANTDFYRWAYTAVTRASKRLYCLNPPRFNPFSAMSLVESVVQNALQELAPSRMTAQELYIDESLVQKLNSMGLKEQPIELQNHFLNLNFLVGQHQIEIISWAKVQFEIRYGFKRGHELAMLKCWINGKNEFRATYQKIPTGTNSDQLYGEIVNLLEKNSPVVIVRDTQTPADKSYEFPAELEEAKPFLKNLFDGLQEKLQPEKIIISTVEHLLYRDRYTFTKNQEKAVVDFEYNKDGFFGRVLALDKQTNSHKLLLEVQTAINNLKL